MTLKNLFLNRRNTKNGDENREDQRVNCEALMKDYFLFFKESFYISGDFDTRNGNVRIWVIRFRSLRALTARERRKSRRVHFSNGIMQKKDEKGNDFRRRLFNRLTGGKSSHSVDITIEGPIKTLLEESSLSIERGKRESSWKPFAALPTDRPSADLSRRYLLHALITNCTTDLIFFSQ